MDNARRRGVPAACGYLVSLAPPLLCVVGIATLTPMLAFLTVFIVFPLLRPIVGEHRGTNPLWTEPACALLEAMPFLHAAAYATAVCWMAFHLGSFTLGQAATAALSLWITNLLATCPAHELLHRRTTPHQCTGLAVSGIAGYPILGQEHAAHHRRPGDVEGAEWPASGESSWRFAVRRLPRAWSKAVQIDRARRVRDGTPWWRGGLAISVVAFILTAVLFLVGSGPQGLAVYAVAAAGTTLGVQLITYVQHWSLGAADQPHAERDHLAWEDSCLLQAWLTFHISFHQAHHRAIALPYYRLLPRSDAPRAPAGYVVLMVIALFPGLWRRLLLPHVEAWRRSPTSGIDVRRRITCFKAAAR